MAKTPFVAYLTLNGDPESSNEMGAAPALSVYQFNHKTGFRVTVTGMTIQLGDDSSFREIGYAGDNQPLVNGWTIVKSNRAEAKQIQTQITPSPIRRNIDLKMLGIDSTYEDKGSGENFLRIKLTFPEGSVTLSDSTENIQLFINDQMSVQEQKVWIEGFQEPIPSTG